MTDSTKMAPRALRWCVMCWVAASLVACSEPKTAADAKSDPCDPKDDVEKAANVAEQGAKTGGSTAIAGVETFGKSVGGLVTGGTEEAKEEWKAGAQQTKKTARAGADDTKEAAHAPKPCDP